MSELRKPSRQAKYLCPVLIVMALAVTALWVARPLWLAQAELPGGQTRWTAHNMMFDNHERLHFVIRLVDMDDAIRHGQWPVRWCTNFNGGYGYPFFNFYAPLGYYLAGVGMLAGLDAYNAWKVVFVLLRLLAGLLMFGYARQFFGRGAALATALLFQLAPYHLVNLYVRGNVAELTAMSLFPGVLWAWHAASRSPGSGRLALAAVSLALLVFAHNITALFGTIFLCVYLLALWGRAGRSFPALKLLGTGLAGVGLAAFFWMPAILEMRHVQAGGLDRTFGETSDHLVHWPQFFQNRWGFGLSGPGPGDGMPFTLGWAHWLGAAGALAIFGWIGMRSRQTQPRQKLAPARLEPGDWRFGAGWLAVLLVLMSLMSPLGGWFWKLPLMGTIQFPWRALLFATIAITMLAGWSVELALRLNRRAGMGWAVVLMLTLAVVSAPQIAVSGYFQDRPPEFYTPAGTRSQPHWVNTNIGEFLPLWVDPEAYPPGRRLSQYAIRDTAGRVLRAIPPDYAIGARFRLETPQAGPLTYDMHYFPGWRVTIGGRPVQTRPSASLGLIEFDAPAGTHEVHIRLGYSPVRRAGTMLSVLTLLLGAGLLGLARVRRNRPAPSFSTAPASNSD